MSIQPSILCPHCGAKIEIEARAIQAELPLGPIDLKNKLDSPGSILQAARPRDSIRFGSNLSDPPPQRDSTRIESPIASYEEGLIESLQEIVGEKEWTANAALWRWRAANQPRATADAIEDWKLRTPDQRRTIKNRAAWLTDRFKRALPRKRA